jgi:hypothetical protein
MIELFYHKIQFSIYILIGVFEPNPTYGSHTIAGENFELNDGIFGLALERNLFGTGKDRKMYFHALASDAEYSVPLSVLNNRSAWLNNENAFPSAFEVVGTKGSQSAASTIDTNGNLFFSLNNKNSLACWDTSKRTFSPSTITVLVRDDEQLQFPSGMKVIRNTDGEEELWVVTNRFQVTKKNYFIPS